MAAWSRPASPTVCATRVAQVIYIDAFVPGDGQSLFDLNEPGRASSREGGEERRWLAHPADAAAAGHVGSRRRMAQPAPRPHADQML